MKRTLVIAICLVFVALLSAQPFANVRLSENIRYTGNVFTDAAGDTWTVWEENTLGRYRVFAQRFNNVGSAMFASPLEIELADVPVKMINAVAASDQGVLILYALQSDSNQVDYKLQKINPLGQTLWANGGVIVAQNTDIKQQLTAICANNLGGAFVLTEGTSNTNGYIFLPANINASGTNVWTASPELTFTDTYSVKQVLQTKDGNLIMNLKGYQKQSFYQVNNSGDPVGPQPMFDNDAPIPVHARMIKASNGNIMLYTDQYYYAPSLGLQMLDENNAPIFSTVKEIPFSGASHIITAQSVADGGFYLSYQYPVSDIQDQHTIKTYRLDANLDQYWTFGAVDTILNGDQFSSMTLATDAADNLLITALITDDYYNDAQIMLEKLDGNGNLVFQHMVVSTQNRLKYHPRLAVQNNNTMLIWQEYDETYCKMKRQIFDGQGNELLLENGEVFSSRLAGSAELTGVYQLGNRSISIWGDNRSSRSKIYYQILDDQMNPILPINGKEFNAGSSYISITKLAVSNHNTLAMAYYLYEADDYQLYYQEIDANGELVYPGGGIYISDANTGYLYADIGFDGEDVYLYWRANTNNPYLTQKVMGQKLHEGSIQWESGGRDLFSHAYLGQFVAQDRFLAFTASDVESGDHQVRALRFNPEGQIEEGWGPNGILLFTPDAEHQSPQIQSVERLADAYYCFCSLRSPAHTIYAQRVDQQGNLLWDNGGLQIGNPAAYGNIIVSMQVSDHITMLIQQELVSAYLHKIDSNGNLQFGSTGLLMPGNGSSHRGARLVEHDNGSYSFFWTDYSGPMDLVNYAAINPSGTVQVIQNITSGNISCIFASVSEDQASLYWNQYHNDDLTFDEYPPISIFSTSLPEPVAITDPVAGQTPMLQLTQNAPNPFRTTTNISYKLGEEAPVELQIFNIKGQLVHQQYIPAKAAGAHNIEWNGRDSRGNRCAGGVYFYKVKSGRFSAGKKMILLR
ncbi:MAG TPA: FlgD immunoglobulin-like domain containing protein [Candidatus Cloacimonadota bacterium]|nr:FlgD immunoglobulin-like domain containing protein [Candidatus Cloacimonadota bacterium]